MNDLTEQWKKGELPWGWYYIKIADIVFIDFFEGKVWKNKKDEYIDEVLAPVPDYNELQNINKSVNDLMASNIKLVEENTKLKELLKECRDVAEFTKTIVNKHKWLDDVITKINQALGEE